MQSESNTADGVSAAGSPEHSEPTPFYSIALRIARPSRICVTADAAMTFLAAGYRLRVTESGIEIVGFPCKVRDAD